MSRVAAVDCGTNSLRLLVADAPAGSGAPVEVLRRTEIVRLGEGVDRTGRLAPQALQRVARRSADYAAECTRLGVERLVFAATSATRDAANPEDLDAVVRAAFAPWGTGLRVLSGDDEARLTFAGATGALRAAGVAGPYLVVDLGGGSTELVRGDERVDAACSLDIGAVRLHERLAPSDPPTDADRRRVDELVDAHLDAAPVPVEGVRVLVGVAGTSTTVAAHEQRLPGYLPERVHLHRSTPDAVVAAARDLAGLPVADRARLPYLTPGREDVIGAGALVWARVVERAAGAGVREVVTSEHDLLDGLLALA